MLAVCFAESQAGVLVVLINGLVGFLDAGEDFDVELLEVGFEQLVGWVVMGVGSFELLYVSKNTFQFLEDLEQHVLGTVAPLCVEKDVQVQLSCVRVY